MSAPYETRADFNAWYRENPKRVPIVDLAEECSAGVFAVAELASSCAAKLLNARAEQHVNLPWPSFLELYNETSAFNVNSEILCRTMIIALRGAANSQVRMSKSGTILSINSSLQGKGLFVCVSRTTHIRVREAR